MKILFLTLFDINDANEHGIYQDLMRQFVTNGHQVYIVSPSERRTGLPTRIIDGECKILKVRIGNTQKTNIIEKGISTLLLEPQFLRAIKKYFADVKFDLVLYSTPPITFSNVVQYIKKKDGAKTYLLLKDIFPQNAVDIGMISKTGLKGLLYRFFRRKEKKLYALSDRIGCMSQANVDYVIRNNPEIDPATVEVCPNSIEILDLSVDEEERAAIRAKYEIPLDKKVFVYGGNLGKPQGIPFVLDALRTQTDHSNAFFLIVGDGTEYPKLEQALKARPYPNVKLMKRLPKEDYDRMIAACDVGLIFLDHRFTIPNFPSRLLAYMQAKLPVLACTDPNTDVGQVITEGGFGWWCESSGTDGFCKAVEQALSADTKAMGRQAFVQLEKNYKASDSCAAILAHFTNDD